MIDELTEACFPLGRIEKSTAAACCPGTLLASVCEFAGGAAYAFDAFDSAGTCGRHWNRLNAGFNVIPNTFLMAVLVTVANALTLF